MYANLKGKKVFIYTLGCKVNLYESDAMYEILLAEGCTGIKSEMNLLIYVSSIPVQLPISLTENQGK